MNRDQFFESIERGLDGLIARTEPFRKQEPRIYSTKSAAHDWTLGQLFDHLVKADVEIGKVMNKAVETAPAYVDEGVRHTLIGRMIIGAMAKPNAPVPKAFLPQTGGVRSVEDYFGHLVNLRASLPALRRKNLAKALIPSPAAKFIKYNAYDALALGVAHGERHLAQAEAIFLEL